MSCAVSIMAAALAAVFAWFVYATVTLPPLRCIPHAHPAIQLNCRHGRVVP